jgi:hypothetical protein
LWLVRWRLGLRHGSGHFLFNTDDLDRYLAMLDRYNGLYSLLWWLFLLAQFAFLGGFHWGWGWG